jgi:hypothetical protein
MHADAGAQLGARQRPRGAARHVARKASDIARSSAHDSGLPFSAVDPCKRETSAGLGLLPALTKVTHLGGGTNFPLQIWGYRGWDTRQNVFYTMGGQVAYHAGAVGICYDPTKHTQRFITDDPESEGVAEGNTVRAHSPHGHPCTSERPLLSLCS